MQGDPQVLSYLDRYLSIELTGYKQYLLHAGLCRDAGLNKLADKQHAYSEEEFSHSGRLLARLLFLQGVPGMQDARQIEVKTEVEAQLQLDQALVSQAIDLLREAVACCTTVGDAVSRELFQEMLADEEQHLHWASTQLALLGKMGAANYLQSQM